jgi:anthranilate phosphoribosyltransferase
MDPAIAGLLGAALQASVSAYIAYLQLSGKTPEEIDAMFKAELDKAMKFNPADIKEV